MGSGPLDAVRQAQPQLSDRPEVLPVLRREPLAIPSAISGDEAAELVKLSRGRTVLEIGSFLGYSTVLMAESARMVWSIDPHEGYYSGSAGRGSSVETFLDNLRAHSTRNVIPVIARAQDVIRHIRPKTFEFIFIDISSEAEELIFLANNLEPELIAVHDYGSPKWPGATRAVEALMLMKTFPMRIVGTLAVIERRGFRDGEYL